MKITALSKAVLVFFLLSAGASYGWNRPTHMVIGAMAYKQLRKSSPKTLTRVVYLLRQHPDYAGKWAPQMNQNWSEEEKNEFLLMQAGRWADDIRRGRYDHPTWHYINYAYHPGSTRTDSVLATGETITQAFEQNVQVLGSNAADSTKAIALCWIFHLVGDVHQPLHTSALVSEQFPEGDKGGNSFKIRTKEDGQTINLHSLWDGLLLGSDDFQSVNNAAVQLRHDLPRRRLKQRKVLLFDRWVQESFALARDKAYLQGKLAGSTDDKHGTLLPADYLATAKAVAEKQVALAGYRLAALLAEEVPMK